MPRPTEQELAEALKHAGKMRETGSDPHHIAKALLNLNYRMKFMEQLLEDTKHYLRGNGGVEHAKLLHTIEEVERVSRYLGEEPQNPAL